MNNYISNLSLRGKFLLIAIAMLIPISVLTFLAGRTEIVNIKFAQAEDEGLDWASSLIDIAANLSEFRDGIWRRAFDDPPHRRGVGRLDEQRVGRRIVRAAAPPGAPDRAMPDVCS